MRETLQLPPGCDGHLWLYRHRGVYHPMHSHDEVEINLVMRGTSSYLLKDRRYPLRRGTLIWFFPAQEHVLLNSSDDFAMWIVVFRREMLERVARTGDAAVLCGDDPPGEFCRDLRPDAARWLDTLSARLQDDLRDAPARFNAGIGYLLLQAWQAHIESADVTARDVNPAVAHAARLLRSDAGRELALPELAARCGVSPSHLSRLFARQAGMSLVDFRNRERVERFMQLQAANVAAGLMTNALDAGFGSYAQFHRVFKRVTGHAPAAYFGR